MFDSGSCQVEYTWTEEACYVKCVCHAVVLETHYGFTVTAVIRRSEEELFEFTRRSVIILQALELYCEPGRELSEAACAFADFCDCAFRGFEIEYQWTG